MRFSLVIPVFNEEKIIDLLVSRAKEAVEKITPDFEVIFVNDGSSDNTLSILLKHHDHDSRFRIVDLSRNFGHQAAYTAGLSMADGDYIAMMDGDLQDPPELLKSMTDKLLQEKFDVVYGARTSRGEPLLKKILIKIFHAIFSSFSKIKAPPNVGNFSVMTRPALNAFLELKEKNRYLPGLRYFIGFKQGFILYDRPNREIGEAKMRVSSLAKLALDALYSFSDFPIKFCLYVGILGILFSLSGGGIVVYKKIIGVAISGWTSTLLSIYFFGSVQLFFLGVIGGYVHRIFIETQNRPIFIINKYYK